MTKRREPIETPLTCTAILPSSVFALERDESWPYERFAYNVFDAGVHSLHTKNLPESLTVDFTRIMPGCSPWAFNASASVVRDGSGDPMSFRISVPELTPALFYLFAATVGSDFFNDEVFSAYQGDSDHLRARIQHFSDGASAGVRAYRTSGLGAAIRASYTHLGLTVLDLDQHGETYDLLAKLIAYHEVAHAYAKHVLMPGTLDGNDRRACELIADLIGTVWFYALMVYHTPDADEYRRFRGFGSYGESIVSNALMTYRSQQVQLVLAALAGAQREGGRVSLAGGRTHPPGLQRYMLQHMTLASLVLSDFGKVLTTTQQQSLDNDWRNKMEVLAKSGIMPRDDALTMLEPSECDAVERAAELIEKDSIPELMGLTGFLRSVRGNLERIARGDGP